jgi:hypothetical protein
MNKVNLYFKVICDRLVKCCNHERNLKQQKTFYNENFNIEDLKKVFTWQFHRKIAKLFHDRNQLQVYNDHMFDMAVSACVSGPVFGDTVYGVQ